MDCVRVTSKIYTTPCCCNNKLSLAHVCIEAIDNPEIIRDESFHLIFVVDCSESMSDIIPDIKNTIIAARKNILKSIDTKMTIITFSRNANIIYSDNDKYDFDNSMDEIKANGLTNLYEGLSLAFKISSIIDKKKLIILLSDGNPTIGIKNPEKILELVRKNRDDKTILNTIGYGVDYNPYLLNRIGHFTYIKDVELIPGVIGSMIETIKTTFAVNVCISADDRFGRNAIGSTKFSPLFPGRKYNYAFYVAPSKISSMNRTVKINFEDLNGNNHTIISDFELVEKIPTELKKLYYDVQANLLIYRLLQEDSEPILRRVNRWSEEGKEAAERVRSAILKGYSYYNHASNMSTLCNQIAYQQEYDHGFITNSQILNSEHLTQEFNKLRGTTI